MVYLISLTKWLYYHPSNYEAFIVLYFTCLNHAQTVNRCAKTPAPILSSATRATPSATAPASGLAPPAPAETSTRAIPCPLPDTELPTSISEAASTLASSEGMSLPVEKFQRELQTAITVRRQTYDGWPTLATSLDYCLIILWQHKSFFVCFCTPM